MTKKGALYLTGKMGRNGSAHWVGSRVTISCADAEFEIGSCANQNQFFEPGRILDGVRTCNRPSKRMSDNNEPGWESKLLDDAL